MPNRTQENAPMRAEKPIDALKRKLNDTSVQAQFANAWRENKDTFIASIIELFSGDTTLQQCDTTLLIKEALKAAVLKLPLTKSLGFAYIVPFSNSRKIRNEATGTDEWVKILTPTFVLGYKGYVQLAMRTGQYKTINADVVYEGEFVSSDKLTGTVDLSGEKTSDKVVGYFAHYELLNGFRKTLYMPVRDIATYAKRYSPSIAKTTTVDVLIAKANETVSQKKSGWEGNFNDMALKTVIRRLLSKYGYLSVEMINAASSDPDSDEWSERDAVINGEANKQKLDIADAEYEEVKQPQPNPQAQSGPDY